MVGIVGSCMPHKSRIFWCLCVKCTMLVQARIKAKETVVLVSVLEAHKKVCSKSNSDNIDFNRRTQVSFHS